MINVNEFVGRTDSETFEQAMANKGADGIVLIPPRVSEIEPERREWLIDRAILLPENTTVIMQNSTIKLSDRCRDNFFRTANCGMGIEFPERIHNVHIRGEGECTLIGADHPRASGDGSKILANPCPYEVEDICRLADWVPEERRSPEKIEFWDRHDHSFGTDAGTEESQYGDWRGIGVLFANTENFSISGLQIIESQGWSISLEECANGRVEKITLNACMSKVIDGLRQNMENQDGIDIRNGCHDIVITDITGKTGDDVIALTAIADDVYRPGGSLRNTHVMHNDWTKRDRNIHDIIIRNVVAQSDLCLCVRILPVQAKIWNVLIDGVVDTTPDDKVTFGTVLLGGDIGYGEILPDAMESIVVNNVISNCSDGGVIVGGCIRNSVISNIVNRRADAPAVRIDCASKSMKNVKIENITDTRE